MLLFFVFFLYFVKRNDHFLELRYISAVIIIIIIIIIKRSCWVWMEMLQLTECWKKH